MNEVSQAIFRIMKKVKTSGVLERVLLCRGRLRLLKLRFRRLPHNLLLGAKRRQEDRKENQAMTDTQSHQAQKGNEHTREDFT